jgi:hypothetical protein
MGSSIVSHDPFTPYDKNDKRTLDPIEMVDLEVIIEYFLDFIKIFSKINPKLKKWNNNFFDLIQSKILNKNYVQIPRLLVSLGILLNLIKIGILIKSSEVPNCIHFNLYCLKLGLESISNSDLAISSLLCLTRFIQKLDPNSSIIKEILIIPFILLYASDINLCPHVQYFFISLLRTISKSEEFMNSTSLESFFFKNFKNTEIINHLEKISCLSFSKNFSFALSCLIMKGFRLIKHQLTIELLFKLIELSNYLRNDISDTLGYI